jgi:cysteinyl-tRNA synthetase
MSKSLGNFFTIRDVLERVGPGRTEDVRLALMRAHYRAELEFSDRTLDEAGRELDRFYRALAYNVGVPPGMPSEKFLACLCDDLNTPAAIAELHRLTDESLAGDGPSTSQLRASGQLLGLLGHDPEVRFQMGGDRAWIEQLIEERKAARRIKDYATAAVIRDKLAKKHIILEDAGDGSTTWRLARNYHGALRAAAGTSVTASAYIVSKQSNANKPTE